MRITTLNLLIIILLAFSNILNSQTVHPDYQDGNLFISLSSDYNWQSSTPEFELNDENFAFFTENEKLNYGISEVTRPFFSTKSEELRNTIRVVFTNLNSTEQFIEILNSKSDVNFAEKVPLNRISYTPNDLNGLTGANNSWHLLQIEAEEAWDYSQGSSNIVVAIVDDAVEITHSDLNPNLWINAGEVPNNGLDDDGNGFIDDYNGFDVASNDSDPNPTNANYDHGTHVAGISAATTDNGLGIASIGFSVSLMAVKATTNPGFVSSGYAGITYAADNGARVINCSWGGFGQSNTARNVIEYATEQGSLVVGAAGNDDVSSTQYPAGYSGAIAVASTARNDNRSSFTNYGNWIDISAPGSDIWSTDLSDGYRSASGTSMASPFVAGLCGLMFSLNPNLSNNDLLNCLQSSADNIDTQNPSFIGLLGAGRINAKNAMSCVNASISAPPTPRILYSSTQICPGDSVKFEGVSTFGLATTYLWSFPNGSPQNSTAQNPTVFYNNPGINDVQLTLGNQFGSNTVIENDLVKLDVNSRSTYFQEDFEGNYLANGWTVTNPDNSKGWVVFNVKGSQNGEKAAVMNFYNYNNIGERDQIISPAINLSDLISYDLSFDHAYSKLSTSGSDSLIIRLSTDNGQTFPNTIARLGESGNGELQTVAKTSSFLPTSSGEWCFGNSNSCKIFDISAYAGFSTVKIMFEAISGNGNNLFLDNIKIGGACISPPAISTNDLVQKDESLLVYPNPANSIINLISDVELSEIMVFDIQGKVQLKASVYSSSYALDINSLSEGLYLVQARDLNNKFILKKFIKE